MVEKISVNRIAGAEAVSGRATGVLFFAGFGILWFCTGLTAMHRFNIAPGAVAGITLAALAIPAFLVLKRVSVLPGGNSDPELEAEIKSTFNRVNTIQWAAIPVAVVLLNVVHKAAYIVPAIATIVGLHLFPLARAFRYPVHYVTVALLVLWSIGSVFLLRREDVASIGALGTALILLLSAAYTLTNAVLATRRILNSSEK